MWGCCPFSEATVKKAPCFFENSSYLLSPAPHRRIAMGNVCQRTREDKNDSSLFLDQNEGGKQRKESWVQSVQRHWDSSKSELERQPERKRGELEKEE